MKQILTLFLLLGLLSCKHKKINPEIENIVNEWGNRIIVFPDIEPAYPRDTISTEYGIKDYKIVLYTDSTGCVSCKLRLYSWIPYIEKLNSKVDFLFYFNIRNKDKEAFLKYLGYERLNHPVYIDTADRFNQMNKLPTNDVFHCFLLDKNNKVLPVHNFNVSKLYGKIIAGKSPKLSVTTVETEQTEIELKDLKLGESSEAVFILKNTGNNPLVIQHIETSCGCTVPEWEKQPTGKGQMTEIKVKITPEKRAYFNKTVTVHSNNRQGKIIFRIKGTVD
jgi:hypothetical protein